MRLIIVSGQSGAGKSVALRVLEDIGYYCVDNLPLNLLDAFTRSLDIGQQNVAVSVDIRNLPENIEEISQVIKHLNATLDVTFLFLHASKDTLVKRYSETRRIHPLSIGNAKLSLAAAIDLERHKLNPLIAQADLVIDSSNKSLYELNNLIRLYIEGRQKQTLVMVVESFGFKNGVPVDADFVFDARFLPNPHWEVELRPMTGLEKPVADYLIAHQAVLDYQQDIIDLIEKWLPELEKNNRSYLTVAIGCTGGKHRSVFLAEQISQYFLAKQHQVQVRHASLESLQ